MPGVRIRLFLCASALFSVATLLDGLAMKKSEIGLAWPGVWPFAHVTPELSVWTSGTQTLKLPFASTYRNGFSRERGVVARVVWGGLGNACAGAPPTPAK